MNSADSVWGHAMTQMSKAVEQAAEQTAQHPMAKLGLQIFQALLIAAAIGSYSAISGSLETIKTQINSFQTTVALLGQDVEGLKRSRDSLQTTVETLRTEVQRQGYEISRLSSVPPPPLSKR